MFTDLLTYTILPHWFGLPHFFVVGGSDLKPLEGAIQIGLVESVYIAAIILFSLLMTVGLVRCLTQKR